MKKRYVHGAGLVAVALVASCTGEPDASFGDGGRATTTFSMPAYGVQTVVQGDGRTVEIGVASSTSSADAAIAIARYTADGRPDTAFGPARNGRVTGPVVANLAVDDAAVQGDGKVVVLTSNYTSEPPTRAVWRFTANGSPDTTFGGDGNVPAPAAARHVDAAPGGKVVVAGSADVVRNGTATTVGEVVRLTSSGQPDGSFGFGGTVHLDFTAGGEAWLTDLEVAPDGRILVSGANATSGRWAGSVVRLAANGAGDASFGTGGRASLDRLGRGRALATHLDLAADGRIALVFFGESDAEDSDRNTSRIGRLTATGAADTSFGTGGAGPMPGSFGTVEIEADGSGRIYHLGQTNEGTSVLRRYTASGPLDTGFPTKTFGDDETITAVVAAPGGRVTVGGDEGTFFDRRFLVARYQA